MPQYNFRSPGGDAGSAILQILAEREAKQRQAMLDEIARKNIESQIADRSAGNELQKNQLAELVKQREFQHATTIADMAGADERITPDTAALMNKTGLGGRVEDKIDFPTPGYGVLAEENLPPVVKEPGYIQTLKPGARYEQARAVGQERKDLEAEKSAERARIAADKLTETQAQKERDADLRRELQGNQIASSTAIAAAGRENTAAIAAAGLANTQAAEQGRNDDRDAVRKVKDDERAQMAANADSDRKEVYTVAKGILDDPNLPDVIGPIAGRATSVLGTSVDLDARIQRLISLLSLENRQKLKGQGAVSNFEGEMLAAAAQALRQTGDVEHFKIELQRIMDQTKQSTASPSARDLINKYRIPR